MRESTPTPVPRSLEAKIQRDDVEKYKAEFLFRQRILNEKIVDWYGEIKPDANVFDACAGPEGSYLAVSRRGGKWLGNEISLKTAAHLKETGANTVIGTADNLPLKQESIDLVLYVFALNNIENTEGALREAFRVLKSGGSILISDPGQTMWATDLYLYEAMKQDLLPPNVKSLLEKSNRFKVEIPEYFVEHPERGNLDHVVFPLQALYGLNLQQAAEIVSAMDDPTSLKEVRRDFHETLEGQYWAYIFEAADKLGLQFEKLGFVSANRSTTEEGWKVGDVVDVPIPKTSTEFSEVVKAIRANKHEVSEKLVQSGSKISQNIISPVVLLKKKDL